MHFTLVIEGFIHSHTYLCVQVLLNDEVVITVPVETMTEGEVIIDQLYPDTQYTFIAQLDNAISRTMSTETHTTSSGRPFRFTMYINHCAIVQCFVDWNWFESLVLKAQLVFGLSNKTKLCIFSSSWEALSNDVWCV